MRIMAADDGVAAKMYKRWFFLSPKGAPLTCESKLLPYKSVDKMYEQSTTSSLGQLVP